MCLTWKCDKKRSKKKTKQKTCLSTHPGHIISGLWVDWNKKKCGLHRWGCLFRCLSDVCRMAAVLAFSRESRLEKKINSGCGWRVLRACWWFNGTAVAILARVTTRDRIDTLQEMYKRVYLITLTNSFKHNAIVGRLHEIRQRIECETRTSSFSLDYFWFHLARNVKTNGLILDISMFFFLHWATSDAITSLHFPSYPLVVVTHFKFSFISGRASQSRRNIWRHNIQAAHVHCSIPS